MSLVKWAYIGVIMLPAAEVAVFILVALTIGWLWTFALFIATSLLGVVVLKRTARNDFDRFRSALGQDGMRAIHFDSPGFGPLIGGILLVFPGFITDILGALLLVPPARKWAGATIGRALARRREKSRDPSVIDLTTEEWHQVSDGTLEDRRRRKRGS